MGKNLVAKAMDGNDREQTTCYLKMGVFNKDFDETRDEYEKFYGREIDPKKPTEL